MLFRSINMIFRFISRHHPVMPFSSSRRVSSCLVMFCRVVSCRVLSCRVLSCLVMSLCLVATRRFLVCVTAPRRVHTPSAPIKGAHAPPPPSPRPGRNSRRGRQDHLQNHWRRRRRINQHADSLQQPQVCRAVPYSLLALGCSRSRPLPGALLSRACMPWSVCVCERVCVINYIYPATCDPRGSWQLLRFPAPDRNIRHSRAA